MDQDSPFFLRIDLYVLTVRRECIGILIVFNIKDLKSHSFGKSPFLRYLKVCPCTFKEVLDNLNDSKTIFLVYNSLDLRLGKHRVAITSLSHELRHGHSIVFTKFKVTSSQSDNLVLIDTCSNIVLRVEVELQS